MPETTHQNKLNLSSSERNSSRRIGQASQEFISMLEMTETVSFDLFDTLVTRKNLFSPKDLFYRVQAIASQKLAITLDNFCDMRIRAEGTARVRAQGYGHEEITLKEIYFEFTRQSKLKREISDTLYTTELECEKAALIPLDTGKAMFRAAKDAGKPIIIVSDTYFSRDFIKTLLAHAGYRGIRTIYLSSEYRKSKMEGSLFDIVLEDLGITPKKFLHVGDNTLSDASMALAKGIRTYFMPTPVQLYRRRHGLGDAASGNIFMSRLLYQFGKQDSVESSPDATSVIDQTALRHLSVLYTAFSFWLAEKLWRKGIEKVYFASRDGLIMKRFFDLIIKKTGHKISSRYLYVSRAALYPSLIFTDPEEAQRLFGHHWDRISVKKALQRVSLRYEDHADVLAKYGLSNPHMNLNKLTERRFSAFISNVWPFIEQNNKARFKRIINYLRQEKVLTEEKAAFVDIGWHGSLQYSIVKLLEYLGIRKDLQGFYLGIFANLKNTKTSTKATGFLVDNGRPAAIAQLVRAGPSLIELFHSADHGSVADYSEGTDGISPVLEDNIIEREQFKKIIGPAQERAFAFISDQLGRHPNAPINPPSADLVSRIALRFVHEPSLAEANAFGRLKIATDFGAQMKSITGAAEWDLKEVKGPLLPDHTVPIWRPGFSVLQKSSRERSQ